MVEMNSKRQGSPIGKRRRLSRSPSPAPPRSSNSPAPNNSTPPSSSPSPPPPPPSSTPPFSNLGTDRTNPLVTVERKQLDSNGSSRSLDAFTAQKLPPTDSKGQLNEVRVDVKLENETNKRGSLHEPSDSASDTLKLPTPPVQTEPVRPSSKSPVEKVQQVSRKRERTPSPTPIGVPAPKRPALGSSNDLDSTLPLAKAKTALSLKGSQNHTASKETSPGAGLTASRLPKLELSSASKVLTEEIQRQQGQENARLRALIIKEVRKPGKSEQSQKWWGPETCVSASI